MSQYVFGSGSLWACRQDVANSTPLPFGILQEVTIDFAATTKQLYGQYQFPVAVGRGTMKVTGKAKFARFIGMLVNDIFFGQSTSTGLLSIANGESGTIPGSPFQVTVANSATWVDDLGVFYSVSGKALKKVASGPTTGQYSVAAGVYTFAAADTTLGVLISYTYTGTGAAPNQRTIIANPLLGVQPTFQAWLQGQYGGNQVVVKMMNCVSNKWSLQTKLEDFVVPELDFDCFVDASNNLMTWGTVE